MPPSTHKLSGSNQSVGTPPEIFSIVYEAFDITCDVTASANNALCTNFLTEQDNSLELDWEQYVGDGWAWNNHPYNNCRQWFEKMDEQAKLGVKTVSLQPCSLHRKYCKKFLLDGRGLAVLLYPAVKFVGYDNASSVLHQISLWHPRLSGVRAIEWLDWSDHDLAVMKLKGITSRWDLK